MARVHQTSQGEGITVAVIDAGINGNHPDLTGNVLQGVSLVPGHPGNGWDDTEQHGTAMAGFIAAHGHNGGGALGIAPKAKILPIQLPPASIQLPPTKSSDLGILARGIDAAVQRGARVISISQSAPGGGIELENAVRAAQDHDVVVVAAAGNLPQDAGGVTWPARYDGVVAVAAIDRNGNHPAFSVTGPQVLVSAPGAETESTSKGNGYQLANGTSDATAITAGVVALIRSRYPKMSAVDVIHRLTATAIDKGPKGRDPEYGYGVVNPYAALTADIPSIDPTASATPPASGAASPSPSQSPAATRHTNPTGIAVIVVFVAVAVLASTGIRRAATRYRRSKGREDQ
ncbi:MAG: type VII secretion-associated serine protease mycosin [Actinobacteria bacterium 13_2_20CM_2_71_6]|nr:MAG: type VII secretion-associated serine protease mycosin [Actinobacteria bacterium 13_2_20CM_2_71_6]